MDGDEAAPYLERAVAAGAIAAPERDLLAAIMAGRSLAEALGANPFLRRRMKTEFDGDVAAYVEDLSARTAQLRGRGREQTVNPARPLLERRCAHDRSRRLTCPTSRSEATGVSAHPARRDRDRARRRRPAARGAPVRRRTLPARSPPRAAGDWRFPADGLLSGDGLVLARLLARERRRAVLVLQAQGAVGLPTYARARGARAHRRSLAARGPCSTATAPALALDPDDARREPISPRFRSS